MKAIASGLFVISLLTVTMPAAASAGQMPAPTVSAPHPNVVHVNTSQTLNIGSQSKGAGAGKITFNPFSITRKTDRASPNFFSQSGK